MQMNTLVLGVSADHVEDYLRAISEARSHYGMELHPQKFQLLNVRSDTPLKILDGSLIEPKASIEYLSSLIAEDGRCSTEVARRVGRGTAAFKTLEKVWRRSSINKKRKVEMRSTRPLWSRRCFTVWPLLRC